MAWLKKHTVASKRQIRVIILSDAAAEGDDAFALSHALLSERFIIKGLIACHFGGRSGKDENERSFLRINELLSCMQREEKPVLGSSFGPVCSDGSRLIVSESLKDDSSPLVLVGLGPLSDVAAAILEEPLVCSRAALIWVGGSRSGASEFNARSDTEAANIVFSSNMPVYQIPQEIYSQLGVSFAELRLLLSHCGKTGTFLYNQLLDYAESKKEWSAIRSGETWTLGDNSAIGVLLSARPEHFDSVQRHCFLPDGSAGEVLEGCRPLEICTFLDNRLVLADLFSKLITNFSNHGK